MRGESVGVEAVRLALLREEGHRERIAPTASAEVVSRVRAMWKRELEMQVQRRQKVSPLRRMG